MAYPGQNRPFEDLAAATIAHAKQLTVQELKDLLRQEGLRVTGNKPDLQIRIIAHIERTKHTTDRATLERIKARICGRPLPSLHGNSTSYPSPYSNHTPTSSLSPQQYPPAPSHLPPPNKAFTMPPHRNPFAPQQVSFADSPFYSIRCSLTNIVECKTREATRDTVRVDLNLQQHVVKDLQDNPNAKVMVFCAAEGKPSEIAFPHQIELKINNEEIKANLRGLKNKPGSTRPVDITTFIRKKTPGLNNTVELTYALTNKDKPVSQKYYLVVSLVHIKPVEALVQDLRLGKSISKDQVLREMQKLAADPDVVATSSVMSLKCPLSYMRIDTPCRGIGCRHNQCFDALSYLQLQEQAPTWTCPICNKTAAWEHLVLDMYMMDVLDSTSKSTEEVTVEPDGRWHLGKEADAPVRNGNMNSNLTPSDDGDSDDLIEITDNPAQSVNRDYHPMTLTARSVQTPPLNSRYDSRAPSTAASASRSNKRPRTNVIDLTLSDDEDDDQPLVKQQRLSMSSSTNSFRARPPDRVGTGTPTTGNGYSFFLPPPNPLPDFDFDRFGPSF